MNKKLALFLVIAAVGTSCAHKKREKRVLASTSSAKAGGIMEARVDWLKKKKEKFDFGLTLSNLTENGLIIYLNDITCAKGNVTGEVKHTFFNTGERTIDFRPGETKKFKLVCRLYSQVDSDQFKVAIRRINSNPSNDGKTVGKLLYKDLKVPINF